MKFKGVLLFAPLALASLVSCGGGNAKTEIKYDDAKKLINESYKSTVKDYKAEDIIIGGQINSLSFKGDFTYWYYQNQVEDVSEAMSLGFLLSAIPNFNVTDSEFRIDKQKLVECTIPATVNSIANSISSSSSKVGVQVATNIITNLPKFPMNEKILKLLSGVEFVMPEEEPEDIWNCFESKPWDNAEVKYYDDNGALTIDINIPHAGKFVNEIQTKIFDKFDPDNPGTPTSEEDSDYPIALSLGVSNIGYINSISLKFNTGDKNIKITPEEGTFLSGALVIACDASFDVDFSLYFDQKFTKQVNIAYQVSEYEYDEDTNSTKRIKTTAPSTDLNDFSQYFTAIWYRNEFASQKRGGGHSNPMLDLFYNDSYDDPVFRYNYWSDRAKNIAYERESYDVALIPSYEIVEEKDPETGETLSKELVEKYAILGCGYSNKIVRRLINRSLIAISINGQDFNNHEGMKGDSAKGNEIITTIDPEVKAYLAASDQVFNYLIEVSDETDPDKKIKLGEVQAVDVFINSTMITESKGEYIIDIPVIKLPEEE